MGQPNADTVQFNKTGSSFVTRNLRDVVVELEYRLSGVNVWSTISRIDGLITKIEYFSNVEKTSKILDIEFSRITGLNGLRLVSSITKKIYNNNILEKTITENFSRDVDLNKNIVADSNSVLT